jgi:hypothetical protein
VFSSVGVAARETDSLASHRASSASRVPTPARALGKRGRTQRAENGKRPFVPPALANLLCSAGDCLVTKEYSPRSPGVFEHNMDARCALLPQP